MAIALAALGIGLIGAGGLASAFGSKARRSALEAAGQVAIAEFEDLGGQYRNRFRPIMQRFKEDRDKNMALYREEMARSREDFSRYFEQSRSEYAAGMERALGEYRTGRESTIQMLRQTVSQQQQAATARNAFTGLGQSSFGQRRVEGIGIQGALQEGAIREQYAAGLSNLEAQRAQGMSTLSSQMGAGLSALSQQQANTLSNMYQTYSTNLAQFRQSGLGAEMGLYAQGVSAAVNFQGQAAQLAGAGLNAAGSAMGSIGGSFLGAGLSGMSGAAAGGASGATQFGYTGAGNIGSTTGLSSGVQNLNWWNNFQGMPVTFPR